MGINLAGGQAAGGMAQALQELLVQRFREEVARREAATREAQTAQQGTYQQGLLAEAAAKRAQEQQQWEAEFPLRELTQTAAALQAKALADQAQATAAERGSRQELLRSLVGLGGPGPAEPVNPDQPTPGLSPMGEPAPMGGRLGGDWEQKALALSLAGLPVSIAGKSPAEREADLRDAAERARLTRAIAVAARPVPEAKYVGSARVKDPVTGVDRLKDKFVLPTGQVEYRDAVDETGQAMMGPAPVSVQERQKAMKDFSASLPALEQLSAVLHTGQPGLGTLGRAITLKAGRASTFNTAAKAYEDLVAGLTPKLARIFGQTGNLNEQEQARARRMLPGDLDPAPVARFKLEFWRQALQPRESGLPSYTTLDDLLTAGETSLSQFLTGSSRPQTPRERRFDVNGNPVP